MHTAETHENVHSRWIYTRPYARFSMYIYTVYFATQLHTAATQLYTATERFLDARPLHTGDGSQDQLLRPILQATASGRRRDGAIHRTRICVQAQDQCRQDSYIRHILHCVLLQLLTHLSHAGVANAQALKAWNRLKPYFSSSESTSANKHVSLCCIVLWRIPY